MFRVVLLLFLVLISPSAFAVEIYSILSTQCQKNDGIIIDVENEELTVLLLSGQTVQIKQSDIEAISIFNTLDNPFSSVLISDTTLTDLREIYLESQDKPSFVGWATKFVENLIIFFDIEGKSHVVELDTVNKIRPAGKGYSTHLNMGGKKVALNLSDFASVCRGIESDKAGLRPSRILGDKIQIEEFIATYEQGFRSLKGFQERTYLYARPFLFPHHSRLGFPVGGKYIQAPNVGLPMYYQWSSGSPYRFQSLTQVGSVGVEWLPNLQSSFAARSEVKSHLFHATFVGNIISMSAGTSYFSSVLDHEQDGSLRSEGSLLLGKQERMFTGYSYNYMVLMGVDYGHWSFSIGTFYPIFLIWSNQQYREVMASSIAPVFRLMYTTPKLRLRAIYSQIDNDIKSDVTEKNMKMGYESDPKGRINNFRLKSYYIRAGADYDFSEDFSVSYDQLWLSGSYSEVTLNTTTQNPEFSNSADFKHLGSMVSISHMFGDYVGVKGYAIWMDRQDKGRFSNVNVSENESDIVYGGYFEFIY